MQEFCDEQKNTDDWDGDWDGGNDGNDGNEWHHQADTVVNGIHDDVPKHIKEIIQRDITELKLLKFISNCTVQWRGEARCIIYIWISVAEFNLQREHAIAAGLQGYRYVMFIFSFPPYYWEDNRDNIDIQILKCMNCEISEVKIDRVNRSGDHHRRSQSMLPGFVPGTDPRVPNDTTDDDEKLPQTTLFGWSVAKRVKVDCIKKLPPRIIQTPLFKISDVLEIVEVSNCDINRAIVTLIRSKDLNTAIDAILSDKFEASSSSSSLSSSPPPPINPDPTLFSHNFLISVVCFGRQAILDCYKNCLICGQSLTFPGMKLTVCNRKLCRMSQQELGLAIDVADLVRTQPSVCDFLISTAYSAAVHRSMNFVTPIHIIPPSGFEKTSDYNPDSDEVTCGIEENEQIQKNLNYDMIRATLDACPSVADMQGFAKNNTLNQELNRRHPLLLALIRWIIGSSRAHLRSLKPDETIVGCDSPHQFVMLSASPEKEARFCELYQKYGSVVAFHGSPTSKWFSILRIGLKNMSGTKFMSTGSVYGPGIYLSNSVKISKDYSTSQLSWQNSMFGEHVCVLAICEIINHPDLKPPDPHYVIQNEDWIVTRFLIVYRNIANCLNISVDDISTQVSSFIHEK